MNIPNVLHWIPSMKSVFRGQKKSQTRPSIFLWYFQYRDKHSQLFMLNSQHEISIFGTKKIPNYTPNFPMIFTNIGMNIPNVWHQFPNILYEIVFANPILFLSNSVIHFSNSIMPISILLFSFLFYYLLSIYVVPNPGLHVIKYTFPAFSVKYGNICLIYPTWPIRVQLEVQGVKVPEAHAKEQWTCLELCRIF